MAMQDQILFTGRELNFEIPEAKQLNAASDRLNAKLEKREDLARKLQDEFRKGMRVDSQVFVSDFARKQQFEAVTDFENKWTKIVRDRGNKLTNEDLIEMENDKAAISRLQNEWLSSQKLWERDQALVEKSPADFDLPKHVAATEDFLTSGVYKPGALEFSGVDMASFFSEEKWEGANPSTIEDVTPGSDFNTFTKTYTNATADEARAHVVQTLFADKTGRALKGVLNDFMQLSPEDKMKYLKDYDKNNSGTIEEGEVAMAAGNVKIGGKNMLDNPIVKWAQDHYSQYVLKTKKTTDKQRAIRTGGGGATDANGISISEVEELPGGIKRTTNYKGAAAAKRQGETPAGTKTVKTATPSWDANNPYTPPAVEDGKYKFMAVSPMPGNLKKVSISVSVPGEKKPRDLGWLQKNKGTPQFIEFNPDGNKFVFQAGDTQFTLTRAQVSGIPGWEGLLDMQINTSGGVTTIGKFIDGGTNTTTSEFDKYKVK